LAGIQPERVIKNWARADGPAIDEVLRCYAERVTAFDHCCDCASRLVVLRVLALDAAQEDVGVSENPH
jgi:hypothetical protein